MIFAVKATGPLHYVHNNELVTKRPVSARAKLAKPAFQREPARWRAYLGGIYAYKGALRDSLE